MRWGRVGEDERGVEKEFVLEGWDLIPEFANLLSNVDVRRSCLNLTLVGGGDTSALDSQGFETFAVERLGFLLVIVMASPRVRSSTRRGRSDRIVGGVYVWSDICVDVQRESRSCRVPFLK